MVKIIVTDKYNGYKLNEVDLKVNESTNYFIKPLKVLDKEFIGFGGAFTESSAYNLSRVSRNQRMEALKQYYDEDGLNYNLGRIPMGGCDFALSSYNHISENDKTLSTFSMERDELYILPLVNDALSLNKNIKFLVSPWTPPYWMKDNNSPIKGGHLKKEYYTLYSDYYVRYLRELNDRNINVFAITIQNEVEAKQRWDSCLFTKEEEAEFGVVLAKRVKEYNKDIDVYCLDHNKEILNERAKYIYDYDKTNLIKGSAVHWYCGEQFEELRKHNEMFPDRTLIETECCIESTPNNHTYESAERYARHILNNLKYDCLAYIDWNLFLDETGGPNWVNNLCDAPVIIHVNREETIKQLSYYAIGQFSKYILPKSKRVEIETNLPIDVVCFGKKNGYKVYVVLNQAEVDYTFTINGSCYKSLKKSIMTINEE